MLHDEFTELAKIRPIDRIATEPHLSHPHRIDHDDERLTPFAPPKSEELAVRYP